jgi:hypothetical protein
VELARLPRFLLESVKGKPEKNHKALCVPYKKITEYAEAQCKRIHQARRESFVCPGSSLLQANQFFDYTMAIKVCALLAKNGNDTLPEGVSMDSFYKNLVVIEQDDEAFRNLFTNGSASRAGASVDSVLNVCVGLMYHGNPPESLAAPKITKASLFRSYNDLDGFVKQSEEMVRASVVEDLMKLYQDG